jgi:hypothetical protein
VGYLHSSYLRHDISFPFKLNVRKPISCARPIAITRAEELSVCLHMSHIEGELAIEWTTKKKLIIDIDSNVPCALTC